MGEVRFIANLVNNSDVMMTRCPMDKLLESAFLDELNGQCNYFALAIGGMKQCGLLFMDQNTEAETRRVTGQRFWFNVQAMLAAFANISKILYPQNKKDPYCARGIHLRSVIGEAIAKPFEASARSMRNHYEHFDERIDDWWEGGGRLRVDYNFFAPSELAKYNHIDRWRNFDANTVILTFSGDNFNVPQMQTAVITLQEKVQRLRL